MAQKKYLDLDGLDYFWDKIVAKFVAKETGKGLSANDFTTAEKTKLAGIESGAEVNVIDSISVNGTAITPVNKEVDITVSAGLSNDIKDAILDCFENVAWVGSDGSAYYNALFDLFYPVASISAVFNQGQNVIYDTDSLDVLKQYLTVTANYEDGTSGTVTRYTLSGTLTVGTSTITVTYGGKTATFNVTVNQDFTFDSFVIGVVQDYTISGNVKKVFYNSASAKRVCTNPGMFKAYNGVKYKFSIGNSSAYQMAVYAVTGLTFNPQEYDYSIVQGTDKDFFQGEQGVDYNYSLLNGAWSSNDYTYECLNDDEMLFVTFRTSSNTTITSANVTAIKNAFSVVEVE